MNAPAPFYVGRTELHVPYVARCPGCGADALFTTVLQEVYTPVANARINRIEVECAACDAGEGATS